MKTLIYQVYVGKTSKLYDHCTASAKKYAEKIGADYYCQRDPILKIVPDPKFNNRSAEAVQKLGYLPIFEKENAFDLLGKYDRIAVIDSDVYIRDSAPDIFSEIDGYEFGAVCEREMPIHHQYKAKIINYSRMQYEGVHKQHVQHPSLNFKPNNLGYEFFNMGVMVLDASIKKYLNGQTAKQFLDRPEWKPLVGGMGAWKWSTDQTLLNIWIKMEVMKVKHLDWRWNGLFTANTRIQECHFVHFFLKDKLPHRGENVQELMKHI